MTGLHLHRSERADALVDALACVLSTSPADPLAPEVVAVPARGVERWVTQRLSSVLGAGDGDGVCANVRFPAPSRLVADAVAVGSGYDPEDDPWAPGRVRWAVLEVIDTCADEPWCAVLARHLRGHVSSRRMVAAGHLAALFTSYGEQRPTVLLDWACGGDTDGAGAALPDDLRWQAELWRRLRDRIGVESPAERLEAACGALLADPGLVDLPERVSLFGPTRLTRGQVAVLAALAPHRNVHLWLPHPSAALWDRVAAAAGSGSGRRPVGSPAAAPRRRTDATVGVTHHQLLSSLGRDAREMQLLLTGADTDQHHPLHHTADTLLGRLQHGLRTDTAPPGSPLGDARDRRPLLVAGDRSLQVHACHGRARQVEVLRDVLLGMLASDPTLEPRDVLVMCPDIESYAPLVSATFGLADTELSSAHPGHRLRVRLADRSLRQTNPLLATVSRLLDLADSRVTASQVLDLVALPPVSRRFTLGEGDLERLRDWVSASGVRWGLDAPSRAPFGLQGVGQNTWQAGLDRVLLGAAMAEDDLRWVGLALPLDDVDSTDVDLAGRLAELVDRLAAVLDRLSGTRPLPDWLDALSEGLATLTSVTEADSWQLTQARRELADVAESAGERAATVQLSLSDVRVLFADRLAGRPTRANFRTGNLTMCSMVPMRSVPHRVVCLVGLDDGVFPRTSGVDGDDVLARDPLVGERDRRSEDRQLLLDAVLAAREYLVVLYTGADERTNTVRPPAVPLGEILDVVDATVRTPDGRPAREHVVVRHPLQPFDPRNFTPGALATTGPFSFDGAGLAGAVAATRPRHAAADFLPEPLDPPEPVDSVALDALVRFFEHPVRGFLRERLGVTVPDEADKLDDALHAELDPLAKWTVGDRWLRDRLAGADVDACEQAEWRRGDLPPGALGQRLLTDVRQLAEPLVAAALVDRVGAAHTIDVTVPLTHGRVLTGTVGGVHGDAIVRSLYSTLGPKHRLRAWIQLLALAASRPEQTWRAATVGRSKKGGVARSLLTAPVADAAGATLGVLADVYAAGLCEPLPLPVAASHAYAARRCLGDHEQESLDAAAKAWWPYEVADPHHVAVWGADHRIRDLASVRAGEDEQPVCAPERETSRFGALSCRLWFPLLGAEVLEAP